MRTPGIAFDEIAQGAREVVGREAVGRADAHVAGKLDVDVGDFRLRVQERALHFLGGGEEALAGAGQPRAGGAPIEQPRAERRLERRDAPADRGVVEPQPLGRRDKLSRARDREEDPDVVPVHGAPFSTISHARCAQSAIAVRESLMHKGGEQRTS